MSETATGPEYDDTAIRLLEALWARAISRRAALKRSTGYLSVCGLRQACAGNRVPAAAGKDYVDKNVRTWGAVQKVLDSGEHRPTHLRGWKP